ncbi:venom protease-like isoform X2 [Harmonia axyridis]|nr:venom protease-like isoform X2 [Harmonia axyridis]XP_045466376.1 venom protease-like isoform X2 [Harmonia axyridis]XP_045466377.1 venom protease-like isoform X2 [Harmonia axyridis]XP_045466378.1 venom protease-like isoform X2 [Harmonia axyridis]
MYMYISFLVLAFLGSVFSQNNQRVPPNPCPTVFGYYYDNDGSIFAEILVPNDGSKVFKMEVNTSYIGLFDERSRPRLTLDLITPKDYLLEARQLTYKLTFTKQEAIPRITQIKFNNRIYCRGPSEMLTSAGVTDLWVFKETRLQTFTYYPDQPSRPEATTKPTIPPFIPPRTTTQYPWLNPAEENVRPAPLIDAPQNDPNCGISDRTLNLITDGMTSVQNEFPWLVALYQWKGLNYEFRCTANLVDTTHVVTVGSCLKHFKANLVKTEDILLVFGKSRLRQWADDSNSVVRTVSKVEVNPDYTQYTAHGDVAVLTLKKPVQYSRFIKPICLWGDSNTDVQQWTGRYGTVAGWGKDDYQGEFLVDAKKVEMPIVSENTCLMSNREFSKLISHNTFCAGERNGRGPCTGDIGSPFMLEMNGKWYLRGLVSKAIVDKHESRCTLDEYTVFADVAKYSKWISRTLNNIPIPILK